MLRVIESGAIESQASPQRSKIATGLQPFLHSIALHGVPRNVKTHEKVVSWSCQYSENVSRCFCDVSPLCRLVPCIVEVPDVTMAYWDKGSKDSRNYGMPASLTDEFIKLDGEVLSKFSGSRFSLDVDIRHSSSSSGTQSLRSSRSSLFPEQEGATVLADQGALCLHRRATEDSVRTCVTNFETHDIRLRLCYGRMKTVLLVHPLGFSGGSEPAAALHVSREYRIIGTVQEPDETVSC